MMIKEKKNGDHTVCGPLHGAICIRADTVFTGLTYSSTTIDNEDFARLCGRLPILILNLKGVSLAQD